MQGSKPDESLDVDLALPRFQSQATPEGPQAKSQTVANLLPGRLAGMADMLPTPRFGNASLMPGELTTLFSAFSLKINLLLVTFSCL